MSFFTRIEQIFPNKPEDFKPITYKFLELIGYLKGLSQLNLQVNYLKNLDLLKESLRINRKVPELEEIESSFKEIFVLRYIFLNIINN